MITYSVGNVEIQWLIRVMTTKIPKNIRIPHFGVCIQFVAASSATKVVKFFFYFFFVVLSVSDFFLLFDFRLYGLTESCDLIGQLTREQKKKKKTPGKRNLENTKILTVQFFFHTPLFPFPTNYSGRTKFFFSFFHSFIRITNFAHFLVRFFFIYSFSFSSSFPVSY